MSPDTLLAAVNAKPSHPSVRLMNIVEAPRHYISSTLFSRKGRIRVALLDFIGARNYFITEYGAVFSRNHVVINVNNKIVKGYLPLRILDPLFPYPWVELNTQLGYTWYPINQLLGWAFDNMPTDGHQYFICDEPFAMPYKLDKFHWSDKLDIPEGQQSGYKEFVDRFYMD